MPMITTPMEHRAVQHAAELELPLKVVEDSLAALGVALHHRDVAEIDRVASELHRALAAAIDSFGSAARIEIAHP